MSALSWKVVLRLCQVVLAAFVALAVWSVGFASDGGPTPVLPDTDVEFSLDMTVVGSADHPVVYAVEQRARPDYRIFAFDPTTGVDTTLFTVPERALVYGIALSTDRSTLAVSYTPEFDFDGSGLWTLDLSTRELTMIRGVERGVYHVDPAWTADGTALLSTRVDRRDDTERLGVTRTAVLDGSTSVIANDAIDPVAVGDAVYALAVDESRARREIVRIDDAHATEIARGPLDLDHLAAGAAGAIHAAAIGTPEPGGGLTLGSRVSAHGNHRRPSSWWTVAVDETRRRNPAAATLAPSIVHDAAYGDGALVVATAAGLELARPRDGSRVALIESRAIRFVAA